MATPLITDKYQEELYGVLNCYDRVISLTKGVRNRQMSTEPGVFIPN
jgi:hypothetical protein